MASGILRNATRRSLCSYAQHLWRPKQSLLIEWTHAVSGIPQSGFKPVCSSVIPLDYVSHASTLSYKYLSTSSMNPEELAAKKPVEVASKEGEKAEESHQTGPAGKPIRRGPVTWLSLLLLILTGAGLIFYFDKEKKRHIEGRLLWRLDLGLLVLLACCATYSYFRNPATDDMSDGLVVSLGQMAIGSTLQKKKK